MGPWCKHNPVGFMAAGSHPTWPGHSREKWEAAAGRGVPGDDNGVGSTGQQARLRSDVAPHRIQQHRLHLRPQLGRCQHLHVSTKTQNVAHQFPIVRVRHLEQAARPISPAGLPADAPPTRLPMLQACFLFALILIAACAGWAWARGVFVHELSSIPHCAVPGPLQP